MPEGRALAHGGQGGAGMGLDLGGMWRGASTRRWDGEDKSRFNLLVGAMLVGAISLVMRLLWSA
jgi:hypothetical protein